jgi:hypothetical protein
MDDVYYRILEKDEKLIIVAMQPNDEAGYDHKQYLLRDIWFATEVEAQNVLLRIQNYVLRRVLAELQKH